MVALLVSVARTRRRQGWCRREERGEVCEWLAGEILDLTELLDEGGVVESTVYFDESVRALDLNLMPCEGERPGASHRVLADDELGRWHAVQNS